MSAIQERPATRRPPDDLRTEYGPAPERTEAQRMEALERANHIRTRRAQLKRDLKARRVSIDRLLLEPPEWLGTMKVSDLLMALPKIGRVKTNVMLGDAKISPSKTVIGLSPRQRRELRALLLEPAHPTMRRGLREVTRLERLLDRTQDRLDDARRRA